MKKIKTLKCMSLMIFCLVAFIGCTITPVTADNGFQNNNGNSENTGEDGDGWSLCKNSSYDIFDFQVWSGAGEVTYENKEGYARFTYNGNNDGWSGGGLVRAGANNDATIKSFNMENAKKMKFQIRGTADPKTLCFAIQRRTGTPDVLPSKVNIVTSCGISSLSETEWTEATYDFSSADTSDIINAFLFIVAEDWSGKTIKNAWFEIKNLDWIDADGNSVTLSIKTE